MTHEMTPGLIFLALKIWVESTDEYQSQKSRKVFVINSKSFRQSSSLAEAEELGRQSRELSQKRDGILLYRDDRRKNLLQSQKSALKPVEMQCPLVSHHKNCFTKIIKELDLSETERLHEIVDLAMSKFGRLDVLVNNAGTMRPGGLESQTSADFDFVMAVNCKAPVFLMKAAIEHLKATKGNVVNISSTSSFTPFQGKFWFRIFYK